MTPALQTAADVQAWVSKSRAGDRIRYHLGNIGAERERARRLGKSHPLGEVFAECMRQSELGYLSLTQKAQKAGKGGDRVFEYWAERRFKKPDHAASILRPIPAL